MNKSLKELSEMIHKNVVSHGFYEPENIRSFPELVALMHCELSEAMEEYRNNKPNEYVESGKPEGMIVELADCVMRILDYSASIGIDLEEVILRKHEYNLTRTFKHGGKKI